MRDCGKHRVCAKVSQISAIDLPTCEQLALCEWLDWLLLLHLRWEPVCQELQCDSKLHFDSAKAHYVVTGVP